MKSLIVGFILVLAPILSPAQPDNPTVGTNTAASNPASADQAPDDVLKKLRGLIDARKYPEAQQMVTGLLAAYPDDLRLTKAKALLDKLVTQQSASTAPAVSQSGKNAPSAAPPPAISPVDQLTGMDKIDYNALIERAREAQQTTDLDQQKQLLQQFMDDSSQFLQKHPEQMLIWQFRAVSALSLDDPDAGYEAGEKLLAGGAADSNDAALQQLMAQLKNKGWLDKQELDYKSFGWVLGTWNVSRSLDVTLSPQFPYADIRIGNKALEKIKGEKEEFVKSGKIIEGYEISADGVRSSKPDLRGAILNSGEISWECYLPPSESDGIYVFRIGFWGLSYGRTKPFAKVGQFYPSGWQPVNSSEVGSNKEIFSVIIPLQWSRPDAGIPANKNVNPATLLFTKIGSTQN